MGYRRETMVLRAPGGLRVGFLIWERGTRQASLRCNLDGLQPEQELRLRWMAEDSFAPRDGGRLHADAAGAVRHMLAIIGDEAPVAVALARDDDTLYAYAFAQSAPREVANAPERLQALLFETRREASRSEPRLEPERKPNPPQGQAKPSPDDPSCYRTWQEDDIPRGLELRRDEYGEPAGLHALWRGAAWPPPPALAGAVWRDGCWAYPLA